MRRFTIIVSILLSHWSIAQVAIDKSTLRSKSSILEFNDMQENNGSARGIILPMLSDNSLAEQGALWFDLQNQKVMYKSATENIALTTSIPNTTVVSSYTGAENSGTTGVIITRTPEQPYSSDVAVLKLDSKSTAFWQVPKQAQLPTTEKVNLWLSSMVSIGTFGIKYKTII
ncbi:hypothetical protein [Riemerella anatipestifer]|uniref:hypothetical protein n=1 Tax=Riemerella anatipestifer TaxID=34085 RepID=UPI0021A9A82A|nr:hypothetical protein [Riemerella anatipestifer]